MAETPRLLIAFEWNHAGGFYEAVLPNGARFVVERQHVGGRLEANLDLFRQALQRTPGTPAKAEAKSAVRATIIAEAERYLAGGGMVQRAGPTPQLRLEDLDLDF